MTKQLHKIPAVDQLLTEVNGDELPRPLVVDVIRRYLSGLRRRRTPVPQAADIVMTLNAELHALRQQRLRPVINGTGVIVHTNLGRSPLSHAAVATVANVASQYSNLEFDLASGRRGSRGAYLERCLAVACAAESATVVNNNAAALILILQQLCQDQQREVIVSRGELVQIGGGFRIPEILACSGARLVEVGTTNQTTAGDYEQALSPDTALVLKVHRSNFTMSGFVAAPTTAELAAVARRAKVPLVEDQGSGALVRTERIAALPPEPTPAQALRQGARLVCFSGDKLLGGPQAGIIAGNRRLIQSLKKAPLFRALRGDKTVLAALQTTVESYLSCGLKHGKSWPAVPTLEMLRQDRAGLRRRAESIVTALTGTGLSVRIGESAARVGGGALPDGVVASVTVDLRPPKGQVQGLTAALRLSATPVVGYIDGGWLRLDLRTVMPGQDAALIGAVLSACAPDNGD